MLLVHDNTCSGYRFSGVDRQLILETEYPCGSEKEGQRSDIVFDGVWCHHLESVQEGNIIFDIEEVDLAQVEDEFRGVFDRLKNYGWPRELEDENDIDCRMSLSAINSTWYRHRQQGLRT